MDATLVGMHQFDLSVYFPFPVLDTEGLAALTKVMLRNVPVPTPPLIEQPAAALRETLDETEAVFVERIEQELGHRRFQRFDLFVDVVWNECQSRLSAHAMYLHDAVDELDEADRDLLELDHRIELARKAAKVHAKLFGDGTEFLRAPYPQQAMHMAARLQWAASKADELDLAELVGSDLVTLLQRCQVRYEGLVHQRSNQTGEVVIDLRELRARLRRRLYTYVGALGSLADERDPASIEQVEQALRPILVARAYTRGRRGKTSVEDLDAALEELVEGDGSDEGGDLGGDLEGDLGADEDASEAITVPRGGGEPVASE